MRSRTVVQRAALIVATAAAGLLLAGQAGAVAAPALTVTPATGLQTGDVVTAEVTDFPAGDTVYITECATVSGVNICDVHDSVQVTVDGSGAGSVPVTVRSSFTGVSQTGENVFIDCTAVDGGCVLGGSTAGGVGAVASISFQ